MKNFEELHDEAMQFADLAYVESRKKDANQALVLENNRKAYYLEKQAVLQLIDKTEHEPVRSIYFRSAACLAFDIGEYREAEKMIAYALIGNPPAYILNDFRKLWRKIMRELNKIENNTKTASSPLKIRATTKKENKQKVRL